MIRILLSVIAFYILYRLLRGAVLGMTRGKEPLRGDRRQPLEDLVEDPHCHTYLPVSKAYTVKEKGKRLYFCSRDCYKAYREAKGNADDQAS